MTRSSGPRTVSLRSLATHGRCRLATFAALAGLVLLPSVASAQGFLDPRGVLDPRAPFGAPFDTPFDPPFNAPFNAPLDREFGRDAPQPFDQSPDAAIFEAILPFGELVSIGGGTAWRPYARRGWRPYADGSWDYVRGGGWLWTGLDPWSDVTDHSGTWRDDAEFGWVWTPGEGGGRAPWEPAKVEWRLGADVIGWAPLSERGAADPRHFVFVPIDSLIGRGGASGLDRAQSRAAYDASAPISPYEAASLSPDALAEHAARGREVAPRVARLPDDSRSERRRLEAERGDPYDTRQPRGRYATPRPDSNADFDPARRGVAPEAPLASAPSRTPPPVPAQRPRSLAALPAPATAPAAPSTPPTQAQPARPTATPTAPRTDRAQPTTPAPAASAEARPDATAPAAAPKPEGPRVVGPQWLANGDCSSRGIREGKCKTE